MGVVERGNASPKIWATPTKVSDEMNVDVAPDGTVYGIELLNANEQLAEDGRALIVELGGMRREVSLAT